MSRKEDYEKTAEKLLLPITEELGIEIVDVEYVKEGADWYLRAYIDKEGGVNIGDCETVSRAFSDKLDEADPIPDAYILEVSSPGLCRPLKKDKDLDRSIGKYVEIRTFKSVEGEKVFFGFLKSHSGTEVTITTEEGRDITFAKKELAQIRLAVKWD